MKTPLHHRLREQLYGDPGRVVPWLAVAFSLGVGALTRSPGAGLGSLVLAGQLWDRFSPRLVIEDPRLGALTLNCPRRDSAGRKQVWLTFDDGPGPDTETILDILEDHQAPATFFLIGEQLKNYSRLEALRQRLSSAGHRVGNHSWSHPSFLGLSAPAARQEVWRAQELIEQSFPNSTLPIFRPPYGYRTEDLFAHLQAARLSTIGWSVNSLDFLSGPAETMVDRVLGLAVPGSILLFHDGPERRERTVSALPAILRGLRQRGYEFGVPTPEEML
jgi:peptidoglycan/xylan/chitin deacetylase (PgdA/CDA1 family)